VITNTYHSNQPTIANGIEIIIDIVSITSSP
jgi:hypothetical protein